MTKQPASQWAKEQAEGYPLVLNKSEREALEVLLDMVREEFGAGRDGAAIAALREVVKQAASVPVLKLNAATAVRQVAAPARDFLAAHDAALAPPTGPTCTHPHCLAREPCLRTKCTCSARTLESPGCPIAREFGNHEVGWTRKDALDYLARQAHPGEIDGP